MRESPVVIVGGGAAGLSSAGALKILGIESTVLDGEERIGASWSNRYERLHLHTVRQFSGLAHFPLPARYPKYVSKDQYAEYLQAYVEHFSLNVALGCKVQRVGIDVNSDPKRPAYLVETERDTWRTHDVVIATGMYRHPLSPTFAGLDDYQGSVSHASAYSTGRNFAGKRVLVVGIGNTGAEIAADLVEQGASFVAISVRTSPSVVPREVLGRPVQVSGILLSRLPPRLADGIGRRISRLALGDLTRYGLRAPEWAPFSSKRVPVIDVGFVENLKRERISVRPNISQFTQTGTVFVDGRREDFDAVIFATGYSTGLDRLIDIPGLLNEAAYPKFASGRPTSQPGFYFIGFLRSNRGHLFELSIDSRRLAASIASESRERKAV
jgi:cation diffusion facilitator CzcD-associated flavoprotein CzcO